MLFQALSICDYQLASYEFDKNGKMSLFQKKFSIPAGTIVDVYGVTGLDHAGADPYSNFIIYHASLPHFFTVRSHLFRPL